MGGCVSRRSHIVTVKSSQENTNLTGVQYSDERDNRGLVVGEVTCENFTSGENSGGLVCKGCQRQRDSNSCSQPSTPQQQAALPSGYNAIEPSSERTSEEIFSSIRASAERISKVSMVSSDGAFSILSGRASLQNSDVLGKLFSESDLAAESSAPKLLQQDLSNLVEIGRGGGGVVYKADWRGAPVACKFIVSDSPQKLQSSVTEAITGRMLAHPHVVMAYTAVVIPVDEEWLLQSGELRKMNIENRQVEQLLMGFDDPPCGDYLRMDSIKTAVFTNAASTTSLHKPSLSLPMPVTVIGSLPDHKDHAPQFWTSFDGRVPNPAQLNSPAALIVEEGSSSCRRSSVLVSSTSMDMLPLQISHSRSGMSPRRTSNMSGSSDKVELMVIGGRCNCDEVCNSNSPGARLELLQGQSWCWSGALALREEIIAKDFSLEDTATTAMPGNNRNSSQNSSRSRGSSQDGGHVQDAPPSPLGPACIDGNLSCFDDNGGLIHQASHATSSAPHCTYPGTAATPRFALDDKLLKEGGLPTANPNACSSGNMEHVVVTRPSSDTATCPLGAAGVGGSYPSESHVGCIPPCEIYAQPCSTPRDGEEEGAVRDRLIDHPQQCQALPQVSKKLLYSQTSDAARRYFEESGSLDTCFPALSSLPPDSPSFSVENSQSIGVMGDSGPFFMRGNSVHGNISAMMQHCVLGHHNVGGSDGASPDSVSRSCSRGSEGAPQEDLSGGGGGGGVISRLHRRRSSQPSMLSRSRITDSNEPLTSPEVSSSLAKGSPPTLSQDGCHNSVGSEMILPSNGGNPILSDHMQTNLSRRRSVSMREMGECGSSVHPPDHLLYTSFLKQDHHRAITPSVSIGQGLSELSAAAVNLAICPTTAGNDDIARDSRLDYIASGDFSFGHANSDRFSSDFDDVMRNLALCEGQFVTCIVMEYCDKGSLVGSIRRGVFRATERWGRATATRALVRTAKEVSQGLSYLHSLNIVHGDLKPGNVLLKSSRLDRRGFTCRISDFGFSAAIGQGEKAISTLAYTAPEAIENTATPASDIWSFGVLLYEMVTGENPFAQMRWGHLIHALLSGEVHLDWPSSIHPVLRRLGMGCTSLDPAGRPSAQVVSKVMSKLEDQLRSSARSSPVPPSSSSSCSLPMVSQRSGSSRWQVSARHTRGTPQERGASSFSSGLIKC